MRLMVLQKITDQRMPAVFRCDLVQDRKQIADHAINVAENEITVNRHALPRDVRRRRLHLRITEMAGKRILNVSKHVRPGAVNYISCMLWPVSPDNRR